MIIYAEDNNGDPLPYYWQKIISWHNARVAGISENFYPVKIIIFGYTV